MARTAPLQSERNSLQTLLTDTKRQLASAKEAHDKQVRSITFCEFHSCPGDMVAPALRRTLMCQKRLIPRTKY